MCGIVGYVGSKEAAPILLEGLRTLEYRGYDSAGVWLPSAGLFKEVGPVSSLQAMVPEDLEDTAGIAHTRWATHGAPTKENAHPHIGGEGELFLVHNGIIENYQSLRQKLEKDEYVFLSDTDTEVLAHLIHSHYTDDLESAVREALGEVRGAYGIVVMSVREPGTLIATRLGSPLVVGATKEGHIVASDPSALLRHTKEVVYLEDHDVAVLTKGSLTVSSGEGEERDLEVSTLEWSVEAVQKQGYEHFMLQEIMAAPKVVNDTLRGRLIEETGEAKLGGLEQYVDLLTDVSRLQIVGCGSAYYAGSVMRSWFEGVAGVPTDVELASEYRYKKNHPVEKSAVLAVSQSGETADTLASIEEAKRLGQSTFGVVNVVGSSIARATDAGVYNHIGPEVAVASTKAFLSQLTVGVLLTLLLGRNKGTVSEEEGREIASALQQLPEDIEKLLNNTSPLQDIAKTLSTTSHMMYIGRGAQAALAGEGALKMKEVSYIHAEGYAGGELKHGPIALLDENFPVIALAPPGRVYEKMLSNIVEVKARGAKVIAFVEEGDVEVKSVVDEVVELPKVHPLLWPLIATVPLHLLAYYVGVGKGYNVDRPRNLAKSVTVE